MESQSVQMFKNRLRWWWAGMAVAYLVIRFLMTTQLDALGPYAAYVFEASLVSVAAWLGLKDMRPFFRFYRSLVWGTGLAAIAGFTIIFLAKRFSILVPFDFGGLEILVFLLLVAPVLEEAIFRFFLWQPCEVHGSRPLAWMLTSFIFAYSHLHAIWFVPPEIHPFVLYQTAYTLVLGLGCGYFVFREKSLVGAILVHFAFNLGFYLGHF